MRIRKAISQVESHLVAIAVQPWVDITPEEYRDLRTGPWSSSSLRRYRGDVVGGDDKLLVPLTVAHFHTIDRVQRYRTLGTIIAWSMVGVLLLPRIDSGLSQPSDVEPIWLLIPLLVGVLAVYLSTMLALAASRLPVARVKPKDFTGQPHPLQEVATALPVKPLPEHLQDCLWRNDLAAAIGNRLIRASILFGFLGALCYVVVLARTYSG